MSWGSSPRKVASCPTALGDAERGEAMTDAATGEGLLRAILAEPGDDALRLIYADWLEEEATL